MIVNIFLEIMFLVKRVMKFVIYYEYGKNNCYRNKFNSHSPITKSTKLFVVRQSYALALALQCIGI